jgi:hypothetical protein
MPVPKRVICEFIPMGNYVKVCAVCEDTGREVSIVGDPRASQAELERIAINKLKFVMKREDEARAAQKKGLVI